MSNSSLNKFVFILAFFLALTLDAHAQDPSEEEIAVNSSITILNAVVTDENGEIRKRLSIDDFHLSEDGEPQKIDFVEAQITPFAAVILLDVSGSMESGISLARSAAIRFLEGLRPNDNAAVFSFASKVELVQDFSSSRDLRSRVYDLEASGNTSLYDAVHKAAETLSTRTEKRRAIIVLSDGEDTRSRVSSSKALKAAQNANATIYTVDMSAIGGSRNQRLRNQRDLRKFAEETGGIFVKTPGGADLRNSFANIVEELGVLYTLGYYSRNETKDGKWRRIRLTTKSGDSVRTREGYYAVPD